LIETHNAALYITKCCSAKILELNPEFRNDLALNLRENRIRGNNHPIQRIVNTIIAIAFAVLVPRMPHISSLRNVDRKKTIFCKK